MDFDGFKDGALLEVKGPGYKALLEKMYGKKWFKGLDKMIEQAERQIRTANGTPIQWHFAEREIADAMRNLLLENEFDTIKVVHTPLSP